MLVGVRVTVAVEEEAPVPVRLTACGAPAALSLKARIALKLPTEVGLKAMETVQLAPGVRDDPQVVADLTKAAAPVPMRFSPERVTVPVPVFFTVTICAGDVAPTLVVAKVRDVGESDTVKVAAVVPVPVSVTD